MPTFADLMGISGGAPGGPPFYVNAVANVAVTIPDGVRIGFLSVRSNTAPVTVTLPAIASSISCALVLSCPDGAANAVTVAARAGNTVLGGASASIAADNLVVLIGLPGTTNWEGHVGT